MLGAKPAIGRLFVDGDDDAGASRTVILSHGYWQRTFGGRPDVLGTSITIDSAAHAIVGVLSPDFPLTGSLFAGAPIELYMPLERNPNKDNWGYFMTVLGRLRPGATIEQARAELAARNAAVFAKRDGMTHIVQQVTPAAMPVTRGARSPVLLLLGGIGCVLLMACGNLANLLLVRASGRRREMQVRAALGASTRQLLRQTLIESGVLAAIGGAVGVALALGLTRIVRAAVWTGLPRLTELEVRWPAVALALGLCAMTSLVFGSMPLLHLRRRDLIDALRPHAGVTPDRRPAYVQRAGLVVQVAFALLLTVAGGLLFRSFVKLLDVDPGFRPERVVAMRVDPAGRLAPAARVPFFNRVLDSVSALPGIESAAVTINLPMDRNMGWDVSLPGEPADSPENTASARIVSPGYFRTLGIRVIAGRDFEPRDQLAAPWVIAINQTLARRVAASGRDPLGTTLLLNGRAREVIAIVGDVKHQTLSSESGRESYIPHTQAPGWQAYDLVVRASDPTAMLPSIREAIWRVDRNQAVGTPVELQELIDRTLRPHRLLAWLLGGFAAAALVLAALGVYGVVGYRVAQRRKEIAIRVALGAPRWRVTSAVLRDALTFVGLGLVAGIPLALGAGGAVRGYLFGVEAEDPVTLVLASATIVIAALAAAYVPARRAPRVDPLLALRAD